MVSIVSPFICHEMMRPDAMILVFEYWVLNLIFQSPLSASSRGSLVSSHFLLLEWFHLHIWSSWYFSWQYDSGLWFIQPYIWHDVFCINREGNGTPLQYSCLENPMDKGAWWAAVHGVAKSRTQQSDWTNLSRVHHAKYWAGWIRSWNQDWKNIKNLR